MAPVTRSWYASRVDNTSAMKKPVLPSTPMLCERLAALCNWQTAGWLTAMATTSHECLLPPERPWLKLKPVLWVSRR